MTNTEAISFLQDRVDLIDRHYPDIKDYREALVMAIKALEQEPCEDAISREAVHDLIATWLSDYLTDETREALETIDGKVEDLPSVTPTRKKEKWIEIPDNATNGDMLTAVFPNCEHKEYMYNGYFEMYFDNDLKNASYMRVSKEWWNAPYKKGDSE